MKINRIIKSGLILAFVTMVAAVTIDQGVCVTNIPCVYADEASKEEYVVKDGDTLQDIANKYNINVESIADENKIVDKDKIEPGTKLKISLEKKTSEDNGSSSQTVTYSPSKINASGGGNVGKVSINMINADLRDFLSAIALSMGKSIVLIGESKQITFKADDISAIKALELALVSKDLTYVQEDNLIVVGSKDKIKSDTPSQPALWGFQLKHISPKVFDSQVKKLGLPVKSIFVEGGSKECLVDGLPNDLAKINELVSMLDVPENAQMTGNETLNQINLQFITADKLIKVLNDLKIPTKPFAIEKEARTVYVNCGQLELDGINGIVQKLDVVENAGSGDSDEILHFRMIHSSAKYAEERINALGLADVKTMGFNYPEFGKDIIIACPVGLKDQIVNVVDKIDVNPDTIYVPVDYAKGIDAAARLEARKRLLSELTSVALESFRISENVSRDEIPYHVLSVQETSEKVKLVRDMVTKIDTP